MNAIAKVLGAIGVLAVVAGVVGRLTGSPAILGQFRAIHVVIVGTALIVTGIAAKLLLEQK